MNKIKLNPCIIKNIVSDLNEKIVNNHISNLTVVNSLTIILQFSFFRQSRLLISLEKNSPYITLINGIESIPTIDTGFSSQMRHHIKDGYIVSVKQIDDDAIVCIHFKMKVSEQEIQDKYLYIELIPMKPNLIVTRSDNSIVFAAHYSSEKEKRSIIINSQYEKPEKEIQEIDKNEVINLNDVEKYGHKIYEKALIKRKKEKFDKSFKYIKNKIKVLSRKMPILKKEIDDGNNGLIFQDLGNACYYMGIDCLKSMFQDANKKYNNDLTNIENANLCFKLYKKSKNKVAEATKQLDIANQDLIYYNHLLEQCELGDEDDVAQIQAMLFPNKKLKPQERKKIKNYAPYCVKLDTATILFGKNDVQNDYLTFNMAHYKDIFVHIHNYPGAHIIIKQDKLSDEALLTACEFALILSNKDDGDIGYTEIKNVKRTEKLGLVKLKEEKIIHISNIRNKTKQLIKNATKRS